jgi:hypothetical protein
LFDLDKSRSDALRPLCSSQITGGLSAPGFPVTKSQKTLKAFLNLYGPRLSSDPRGPNSVLINSLVQIRSNPGGRTCEMVLITNPM